MTDAVAQPAKEYDPHAQIIEEIRADVIELRRIAFGIEDALQKTPHGISLTSPAANFVKRALFDYADHLELN